MFNYKLMKSMGLIQDESEGDTFISDVIKKLKDLEENKETKNPLYLNNIERLILENKIVLGSPILKNVLSQNEPVSSCTIIPIDLRKDLDNLKNILEPYANTTMGSGYDLNQVDEPCETIEKINSAIHDLIQIYPNRLSAMGTLDIDSKHILEFIELKKNRDFNTCHYNISIKIPDDFFDMGKEYEVLKDGKLVKIKNTELLEKISETIHYCGEPGIIFIDRFNETNPFTQKKYEYKSVAPCAEIAMSEGEVCQFSYINLAKMLDDNGNIDKEELKVSVKVLTRMLDNLCDISIKNAKANPDIIEDKRRIGIGACGFADMLAKLEIPYDSEQCKKLSENLFSFINFYSKVESINLAKERGTFREYRNSLCREKSWYDKFKNKGNEWVSQIDWQALEKGIEEYGIRNSSTTAIPPTGRSATIVNSSYSIEPYFSLYDYNTEVGLNENFLKYINKKYDRTERDEIISKVMQTGDCSELDDKYYEMKKIFKTAREIEPKSHIKILSTINTCIDESISKTINVKNSITPKEIYDYIIYSYKQGINGVTFFRDKCLEERELNEKQLEEER